MGTGDLDSQICRLRVVVSRLPVVPPWKQLAAEAGWLRAPSGKCYHELNVNVVS